MTLVTQTLCLVFFRPNKFIVFCIYPVLFCIVRTMFFCIVSFMYIYSYLFCLYLCKDYCHRVTTQLQLIKIIISLTEAEYVERMEGK